MRKHVTIAALLAGAATIAMPAAAKEGMYTPDQLPEIAAEDNRYITKREIVRVHGGLAEETALRLLQAEMHSGKKSASKSRPRH